MTGQREYRITDEPIPRYSVDKRVRKGRYTVLRDGEFFAEVAVHVDAVRIAMAMEMAHKQVRSRPVQASQDSNLNEQEPHKINFRNIGCDASKCKLYCECGAYSNYSPPCASHSRQSEQAIRKDATGNRGEIVKQIGNAVCPKMAEALTSKYMGELKGARA